MVRLLFLEGKIRLQTLKPSLDYSVWKAPTLSQGSTLKAGNSRSSSLDRSSTSLIVTPLLGRKNVDIFPELPTLKGGIEIPAKR